MKRLISLILVFVMYENNDYLLNAEIIFNNHDCAEFSVKTEGFAPTCTEPGLSDGAICGECGVVITEQTEVPATGHVEVNWVVVKEPTETEEGFKTGECRACGASLEEIIPIKVKTYPLYIYGRGFVEVPLGEALRIELHDAEYSSESKIWYIYTNWEIEGVDATINNGVVEFVMPANLVSITSTLVVHGDTNGDSRVSALDVFALMKALKESDTSECFDVNLDRQITALDKLALYKVIKGVYDYSEYEK
ncbi:MAG: hypothetical protein IJ499_02235 [Clostridia bacterium]|nr:hypothetical protein [Clostridia bacterium]